MKRLLTVGIAIAWMAGGAGLPAQTNAEGERLLESARRTAVIERDLRRAIDEYRRIADRFRNQPAIAVPALLQMAELQETLGEAQARQTLERVVKEYGQLPEYEAAARRRLAGLRTPDAAEVSSRRILPGDPAGTLQAYAGASLARDGRALGVIDWLGSGDIAIQEIPSGAIRRLMIKEGTYLADETGATGWWTMLSPDGRQVVFEWLEYAPEPFRQLRIATTDGRTSRVLLQFDDEMLGMDAGGWAPDGRSFFVVARRPDGAHLARVAVADGAVQLLRSLGNRIPTRGESPPAVSFDGRFIAYTALATSPSAAPPPRTALEGMNLYVIAADGSGEERLVAGGDGTTNRFPVWTPDGQLLFLSDRPVNNRSGEWGLWWVAMREGRRAGPPSPAWPQIGPILPLGMTQGGAFYYIRERSGDDVFTLRMNWSGSLDRAAAVRLTDRAPDANFGPVWSPDGRHVAFKRRFRERCDMLSPAGCVQLVVRSQETGEERVYTEGFQESAPIIWARDGRSILTGAQTREGRMQFLRLDLDSRRFATIDTPLRVGTFLESRGLSGALSDDNTTLYVRDWDGEAGTASIVALDLATSERRVIWSTQVSDSMLVSAPALSPDGRTLAFVLRDESGKGRMARVDVDGTGYRELTPSLQGLRMPQWAEGGRTLLFLDSEGAHTRLMRVAAAGGRAPVFTGFTAPEDISYDLSPDGTQLVFSERFSNELWAIDNLATRWK